MTSPATQSRPSKQGLFVTDAELIRRSGLPAMKCDRELARVLVISKRCASAGGNWNLADRHQQDSVEP